MQPIYVDNLVGKKAKRNFSIGDYFYDSDIYGDDIKPRNYSFSRPFGIPVRYHDYEQLSNKSNFDFVEFHLSYRDMTLNLNDYFQEEKNIQFAVHSPELFEGDHIMDLASNDVNYRERSIKELQKVCEITRELKKFFPKTKKPLIVVNAGGFSTGDFLSKKLTDKMYELVAHSLAQVNSDGVEIIVQTMPPFPWHFGGQSFHNLFVDPHEIKSFCEKFGYRICFDTSHSMMAANHFNFKLDDFTKVVGAYVAHMHIVDAVGVDGEGVALGGGDVDFELLSSQINQHVKNSMFLPEVWQGHKNNGEGFWKAFDYLEKFNF